MPIYAEQRWPSTQSNQPHQSNQDARGKLQEDRRRLVGASKLTVTP
jgi:hypothetical protein